MVLRIFSVLIGHLGIFFGKMSNQDFWPFKNKVFFATEFKCSLYILGTRCLLNIWSVNISSHSVLVFSLFIQHATVFFYSVVIFLFTVHFVIIQIVFFSSTHFLNKLGINQLEFTYKIHKKMKSRGAWVAQLVQCLT